MISGIIELAANCFGREWTIEMLTELYSHFGGSSPMLFPARRVDARRSLLVSLEVRPELHWLPEVFPCFFNSVMVIDIVALEKKQAGQLFW